MSHIVSIQTKVTDLHALVAACRRLGLAEPIHGTADLFADHATGLIVKLPGWTHPLVADTATGELKFDTYGGRWGDQSELNKLLQGYGAEKARIEARKAGHTCTEQFLADGSIKLTIQVGGAA